MFDLPSVCSRDALLPLSHCSLLQRILAAQQKFSTVRLARVREMQDMQAAAARSAPACPSLLLPHTTEAPAPSEQRFTPAPLHWHRRDLPHRPSPYSPPHHSLAALVAQLCPSMAEPRLSSVLHFLLTHVLLAGTACPSPRSCLAFFSSPPPTSSISRCGMHARFLAPAASYCPLRLGRVVWSITMLWLIAYSGYET